MRVCSVDDCDRKHKSKGYCEFHHRRMKTGQSFSDPYRHMVRQECTSQNCDKMVMARYGGLCKKHRQYQREGKDINQKIAPRGINGYEIGQLIIYKSGYVYQKIKKGKHRWIQQHRLIMEKKIGRKLLKTEEVHHKNGIKNDNRLRNLELWSTSHPVGARVKDLIKYAKEILELYGEMK